MAAPESPLCYVGVARQSAAFRLMKQMVNAPSLLPPFNLFYTFHIYIEFNYIMYNVRVGKKEKVLEKISRGSKDTFESKTNKTLLVSSFSLFFNFTFPFYLSCNRYAYSLLNSITGVGLEKPNQWAFDTTQFDNILKRLKVVCFFLTFFFFVFVQIFLLFAEIFFFSPCDVYSKRLNPMTQV